MKRDNHIDNCQADEVDIMRAFIYPKLKPQFDRRRKLMPNDIKRIRLLRKSGFSLEKIAKIFKVVPCTIFYWTNEKYRQWQIKNSSLNHSEMMKNDPEYREREKLSRKDSMYHHLKCDPIGYRKYQCQQTIRWHKTPKGKALVKRINKTFRERHREELILRCRNYYYSNRDSILKKRRIKDNTPEAIQKRKDLWQKIKNDPIVLAEKNRKWKEWAKKKPKCLNCGRRLKPDKEAVVFGTKKWDGHTYFVCECGGEKNKKFRISIG